MADPSDDLDSAEDAEATPDPATTAGMPRWVMVFIIVGVALALLLVVVVVTGGGGEHGPGRHGGGGDTPSSVVDEEGGHRPRSEHRP